MIDWKAYRAELYAAGQGWITAGASAFALLVNDNAVFAYPDILPLETPTFATPIPSFPALHLAVWGGLDTRLADQLGVQALMLAALLRGESDLDSMTAALVEQQDQLLTFFDLHRELRPFLTLNESLVSIADAARRMLQVGGACILFWDDEGQHRAVSAVYEDSPELDALVEQAVATGSRMQHQATLCVPMRIHGAYCAALLWQGRAFESPDIKLMDAVAEQASAHLETVVLYREALARERLAREMELARQVQSYLLPRRPPRVPGLDIFAASTPALSVGGDFYDFLPDAAGGHLFVVGDVSGKGVPAAMIMAMTRSTLRSATRSLSLTSPSAIVAYLCSELYDDFTEIGVFVTLFIARFDPRTPAITTANAGHSPVILQPTGERARLLEADGVPIGTLPENFCQDHDLPFLPGTTLLIGTDGFPEAFATSGEMFGYERLLGLAESTAAHPAQAMAAEYFAAVRDFRGASAQDDDQTLMIIKRIGVE